MKETTPHGKSDAEILSMTQTIATMAATLEAALISTGRTMGANPPWYFIARATELYAAAEEQITQRGLNV